MGVQVVVLTVLSPRPKAPVGNLLHKQAFGPQLTHLLNQALQVILMHANILEATETVRSKRNILDHHGILPYLIEEGRKEGRKAGREEDEKLMTLKS